MVHTQSRMNIFNQACGNLKVCPRGRGMRTGLSCNMFKVFTLKRGDNILRDPSILMCPNIESQLKNVGTPQNTLVATSDTSFSLSINKIIELTWSFLKVRFWLLWWHFPPPWTKQNYADLKDLSELVRHCNRPKSYFLDKMFVIVLDHFRCPFFFAWSKTTICCTLEPQRYMHFEPSVSNIFGWMTSLSLGAFL